MFLTLLIAIGFLAWLHTKSGKKWLQGMQY